MTTAKFLYIFMAKEPILCYLSFILELHIWLLYLYHLYPSSLPTSPMYPPIPLKFMTSTSMWIYTCVYKTYWGHSVALMYVGLGLKTSDCTISGETWVFLSPKSLISHSHHREAGLFENFPIHVMMLTNVVIM